MALPAEMEFVYTVDTALNINDAFCVTMTDYSPQLRRLSYRFSMEFLTGDLAGQLVSILHQVGRTLIVPSIEGISAGDKWKYY